MIDSRPIEGRTHEKVRSG